MTRELATLVRLAFRVRDEVLSQLRHEQSSIVRLHRRLAPDLDPEAFADQLAQSVASVEVARTWLSHSPSVPTNDAVVADFLAQLDLLQRSRSGALSALVELRAFAAGIQLEPDRDPSGIDPFDRFLQDFLQAFDPRARRAAGVYFTPSPIATFIVEGIDLLLQRELGLCDGLADASTWQQVAARCPGIAVPSTVSAGAAFVQVLDPATGTGAFLIAVIDRVHRTMQARWQSEGLAPRACSRKWSAYVTGHLLPALHGYELLMAPHLVARLAIAAKLAATGYKLRATDRLSVWRVDALTPPDKVNGQEARVRSELPMTVMLGNPPFSGGASHAGRWIESLMEDYKVTVRAQERQIQRLSNQYVRFLRLIEWKAQASGVAAIGLITDRGYLDGVLFRDVRRSLLGHVRPLQIVDLGGASPRGAGLGSGDNVFDIRQAVAILLGVWRGEREDARASVRMAHVQGSGQQKLKWLRARSIATTPMQVVEPAAPEFRFQAVGARAPAYATWPSLLEVFGSGDRRLDREQWYGTGIKTRHDRFVMGMTAEHAVEQVRRLARRAETDDQLISELHLCTTVHFDIQAARKRAEVPKKALLALVRSVSWRPLDDRFAVWCREFICEPKERTMRHLGCAGNVALAVLRRDRSGRGHGAFVARGLVAKDYVSRLDDALICPLFLEDQGAMRPNLHPVFVDRVCKATGLGFDSTGRAEPSCARGSFCAQDLLGYIYAILWSPRYRSDNRTALCNDFPRVPVARDACLFLRLAAIGMRLVRLHLLDAVEPWAGASVVRPGTIVQQADYDEPTERVFVQPRQWLHVPRAAWQLVVGSHQVLASWLLARRGLRLGPGDIEHFLRAVQALVSTVEQAAGVDDTIAHHGGWKDAFEVR